MTQPTIDPVYVADTHAIIWYFAKEARLGARAKTIFAAAEAGQTRIVIPVIVLAELYYSYAKSQAYEDYKAIYKQIMERDYFDIEPMYGEDILDFDQDSRVPEMHDRIIAGVARRLNVTLITRDPQIMTAAVVKTIW